MFNIFKRCSSKYCKSSKVSENKWGFLRLKRLQKELEHIRKQKIKDKQKSKDKHRTNPPNIKAVPQSKDHLKWKVVIRGPAGSIYEGKDLLLNVVFSKRYPFSPPKINFKSRIFYSKNGVMRLWSLVNWSAVRTVSEILREISKLLGECKPTNLICQPMK